MAYPKDNRLKFELVGTVPKSENKFIQIQRAVNAEGKEYICVGEAVRYKDPHDGHIQVKSIKMVTIPKELVAEVKQYL